MQKVPYGISNFKDLMTQGYFYVDKTDYIALLETEGKYQFLLRPRRFGKSLFLSTLAYYYDRDHADDFEQLFGDLYIGQHPTPLKNSYPVLLLEFTGIATGSYEEVYAGFNTAVETGLNNFIQRYGHDASLSERLKEKHSPYEKMKVFFEALYDQKILLLIDEYDHFANAVLAEDMQLLQRIVGKGGFVRSFYETLKAATQRGTLDRLFITGVTPLMLDSMTSGFNIASNLSLHKDFNAAMGFARAEVESLLQPLVSACRMDSDELMTRVTDWYNGYRFNDQATETVYNANMVLYFIKNFDQQTCAYPQRMLDPNIASDYGKLLGLFGIGNRDANYKELEALLSDGEVTARQVERFDFDKGFERNDFISLLAYMGFVTLKGAILSRQIFCIPNYAIQALYYQYFKVELERRNQIRISGDAAEQSVAALALQNDIKPLVTELEQVLQLLSNRDALWMNEQHIKTILLTLLYQSPVYFIQSERELNRRYPDVMLLERSPYEVKHQHLIELKYSKKRDKEKGWQAKREEGIQQVQGYLQLAEVMALPKLSAWLLISDGERVEVVGF